VFGFQLPRKPAAAQAWPAQTHQKPGQQRHFAAENLRFSNGGRHKLGGSVSGRPFCARDPPPCRDSPVDLALRDLARLPAGGVTCTFVRDIPRRLHVFAYVLFRLCPRQDSNLPTHPAAAPPPAASADSSARCMSSSLTVSTVGSAFASAANSDGATVCSRRARSRLQAMITLRA
jgi:hypothetical protein